MNDLQEACILFVDDEEAILEILKGIFSKEFGKILTAQSPDKALELAQTHSINLAVLDLKMPKMNGITLLQELRKTHPNLACVFLSGHGDKESVQAALRLGVEEFIDKPFDDRLLVLQVKKALDKVLYESQVREILELFIYHYSELDVSKFDKMTLAEKDKALKAALGVARVKILNKKLSPN